MQSARLWELVIFDCDGVLVDSEPISNRMLAQTLTDFGFPTTYEESVRDYTGLSSAAWSDLVVRRWGRPVPDDLLGVFQTRVFEAFRQELRPVDGVEDVLRHLRLPSCVASSSSPARIHLALEVTGLLPYFTDRIFSAQAVPRPKPFPDIFLYVSQQLGVPPAGCVVIEDSVYGVQAAAAAGMAVLGYAERSDRSALAAAGATVFHHMRDLPDLIEE